MKQFRQPFIIDKFWTSILSALAGLVAALLTIFSIELLWRLFT